MNVSRFGQKIASTSGIGRLMEDLGNAMSQSSNTLMLGGGNPAHIPEVQKYFRDSIEKLLRDGSAFEKAIGNYDPPSGNIEFIEAVAKLLQKEYGWNIKSKNIALTNGSQIAFFILFNIFAGTYKDKTEKKILFPLTPEYIGYCDVGMTDDFFIAQKPVIEHEDEQIFKYHIDFENLKIDKSIGAVCVSRPTNPSGNVLTDHEIDRLSRLASANNIPLIIDNAYGLPFPNIIFTEIKSIWNENIILCLSLSKLGLPSARTGIILANEEIIDMVSKVNAVMSLAPGGMGPVITTDLIKTGQIISLSRNIIRPFYHNKAKISLELAIRELNGIKFHIHKPQGTFFLWLWFPELPITDTRLYENLKQKNVLVVPGNYFFPGLKENWPHKNQCIRVNYSQDSAIFRKGIKIIAEEVKIAYNV
ncbi:MAG: valine--pyruvate transaminase [Sedimentisphaerales bacterium]|nr:valine--pyruvate transaminase [Sedimentisphaerales bacterium]